MLWGLQHVSSSSCNLAGTHTHTHREGGGGKRESILSVSTSRRVPSDVKVKGIDQYQCLKIGYLGKNREKGLFKL